jgi:hypothetical protein
MIKNVALAEILLARVARMTKGASRSARHLERAQDLAQRSGAEDVLGRVHDFESGVYDEDYLLKQLELVQDIALARMNDEQTGSYVDRMMMAIDSPLSEEDSKTSSPDLHG